MSRGLEALVLGLVSLLATQVPIQAGSAPQAASGCLDQLVNVIADDLGAGPGYEVKLTRGIKPGWKWTNGEWVLGKQRGVALGAIFGTPTIEVWPDAFQCGSCTHPCTPEFLGEVFPTLAHELLHFLCPPHVPGPASDRPFDPLKPPEEDGTPPDCNDINYAVNAAAATCDAIKAASDCLEDPECEGIKDEEGNVIPGLERENLEEYCSGLTSAHQHMQDNWNNEENAQTAFACNCPAPWDPGPGYGNCPKMGSPPGGCEGDAEEGYPGNKVIPDCAHSCP